MVGVYIFAVGIIALGYGLLTGLHYLSGRDEYVPIEAVAYTVGGLVLAIIGGILL